MLSLGIFFLTDISKGEPKVSPQRIELPEEAVSKEILDNGLVVLVKRNPPDDLAAIDIKVRAGSSLEAEYTGSGISHLVEHMVFKGTTSRGAGAIEKEAKSYGAAMNASSGQDVTDYHITVPVKYLPKALALLKDMLLNAVFDKTELEKEREVIIKEIKLKKDQPEDQLFRFLNETAYFSHPYKYPVIGYEDKLRSLTRDDLIKYYNRMYVPNRMVIAVVGGVDPKETLAIVEKEFKDFRPADYDSGALNIPAEPFQIAGRERTEEADINLTYLAMAFHSTSLLDQDLFALDVLGMILGRGNNSRLTASLVKDKRIAHGISCWNYTPKDPGLFVIQAVLDKNKSVQVEDSIMGEIENIAQGDVSDEELEAAKRMVLSDFIFSRQTIDAQAADISSNYILTGSYDFSRRYVEGVQAVTKDDLRRVADRYLCRYGLTVVRVVPRGAGLAAVKEETAPKEGAVKMSVLDNGLKIIVREDKKTPTISVTVAMLGGLMLEDNKNNGISNLTATMLLKGTGSRKEDKIRGAIESLGGSINAFSGFNSFGLGVEVLKPDIEAALAIIRDVLTDSIFDETEIDKAKTLILASVRQEDDDIFERGFNAIRKVVFGPSPYGFRYIGETETVKLLTRNDLLDFYRETCVPNNMVIAVSGDVELEYLLNRLKDIFGDLKKANVLIKSSVPSKLTKSVAESLAMDRKESLVLLGFQTTSIKDKDKYALDVLGSVLSGYSGRLYDNLRGKSSLAYTLGCGQKLALDTGYFLFYVATTKDKIRDVKKKLTEEIKSIKEKLAGAEEIDSARIELSSRYQLAMQTNSFYSSNMALDELYGLGYDNLFKYRSEIYKVTAEDVKKVANKYLDLNTSAEIIISPK